MHFGFLVKASLRIPLKSSTRAHFQALELIYNFAKSVMDTLMRLVSEKPVVIFSKSNCCISHAIQMLICSFGANPTVYDLDQHPKGREIENALLALGCHPSVPAVFIGKLFLGGSNELMSLNVQGKLKPLLIQAKAIWM